MATKNMKSRASTMIHEVSDAAPSRVSRNAYIPPPSPPTTRIPSFLPTPTPIPITGHPTTRPSGSPSQPPTISPTHTPVPPKVEIEVIDNDTEQITVATCEDSFVDLQNLIPDVTISDPPLEDVVVEYEYEAFIANDVVDKDMALKEVEYKMFLDVLGASPLLVDGEPTADDCSSMLVDAIADQFTLSRLLSADEDWGKYLGWKNDPADRFKTDTECVNRNNIVVPDATCYPIEGRVTAQVPIDAELTELALEQQIMERIKLGVENEEFQTDSIPQIEFLGYPETGTGNGAGHIDRDVVPEPDRNGNPESLSAFGVSAIVVFSAAITVVLAMYAIRARRRRQSPESRLEQIQSDASSIAGAAKEESVMKVFPHDNGTEANDESIEITEFMLSDAIPQKATETATETGKPSGFSRFLKKKKPSDDISYASGNDGLSRDSAISVETEDFGNEDTKKLMNP